MGQFPDGGRDQKPQRDKYHFLCYKARCPKTPSLSPFFCNDAPHIFPVHLCCISYPAFSHCFSGPWALLGSQHFSCCRIFAMWLPLPVGPSCFVCTDTILMGGTQALMPPLLEGPPGFCLFYKDANCLETFSVFEQHYLCPITYF